MTSRIPLDHAELEVIIAESMITDGPVAIEKAVERIIAVVERQAALAEQSASYGIPLPILRAIQREGFVISHAGSHRDADWTKEIDLDGGLSITLSYSGLPRESWTIVEYSGKFKKDALYKLALAIEKACGELGK